MFGRKNKLIKRANTIKTVPRIVVILDRISAVLRTPNIFPKPALAPPKLPAKPPPLLDCINTTAMRRTETRISKTTKRVNKSTPQFLGKIYGMVDRKAIATKAGQWAVSNP